MKFFVASVLMTFRVASRGFLTLCSFPEWWWHCHGFFCAAESSASFLLTYGTP
jgi:hypothetical protein